MTETFNFDNKAIKVENVEYINMKFTGYYKGFYIVIEDMTEIYNPESLYLGIVYLPDDIVKRYFSNNFKECLHEIVNYVDEKIPGLVKELEEKIEKYYSILDKIKEF